MKNDISSITEVERLAVPVNRRDHIQGPVKAPLTLVEYGDYECPFCGQAHLVVKAVQQSLGKRLRFVFRNFPLSNAHPHAEHAAEAAEAADARSRFWEMHDLLFENQAALEDEDLIEYAAALELDPKQANYSSKLQKGSLYQGPSSNMFGIGVILAIRGGSRRS